MANLGTKLKENVIANVPIGFIYTGHSDGFSLAVENADFCTHVDLQKMVASIGLVFNLLIFDSCFFATMNILQLYHSLGKLIVGTATYKNGVSVLSMKSFWNYQDNHIQWMKTLISENMDPSFHPWKDELYHTSLVLIDSALFPKLYRKFFKYASRISWYDRCLINKKELDWGYDFAKLLKLNKKYHSSSKWVDKLETCLNRTVLHYESIKKSGIRTTPILVFYCVPSWKPHAVVMKQQYFRDLELVRQQYASKKKRKSIE